MKGYVVVFEGGQAVPEPIDRDDVAVLGVPAA